MKKCWLLSLKIMETYYPGQDKLVTGLPSPPPPKFQFWIQSNFIEHVFLMCQWVRSRGEGGSERKLMKILFLFHLLCPVNDCVTRDVFVCFKQTSFWSWLSILRTKCFYHSKVLLKVVMSKKVVKIFETYQSKSSF